MVFYRAKNGSRFNPTRKILWKQKKKANAKKISECLAIIMILRFEFDAQNQIYLEN